MADYEQYYVDRFLSPHARTLDLGTGGGRVAFGLQQQRGFGALTGVDFVPALADAPRRAGLRRGLRVAFCAGNALELPFVTGAFDQVLCFGVLLSHFPRRDLRMQVLAECRRNLRDGRIVVLNAHNVFRAVHVTALRYLMALRRRFGNPHEYWPNDLPRLGARNERVDWLFFLKDKGHLHYDYPGELVADLLEAGFSVLDLNLSGRTGQSRRSGFHRFAGHSSLHVAARKEGGQ